MLFILLFTSFFSIFSFVLFISSFVSFCFCFGPNEKFIFKDGFAFLLFLISGLSKAIKLFSFISWIFSFDTLFTNFNFFFFLTDVFCSILFIKFVFVSLIFGSVKLVLFILESSIFELFFRILSKFLISLFSDLLFPKLII